MHCAQQYASATRPDFDFARHKTKQAVVANIDRLVYSTGSTGCYSDNCNKYYCITRRGICGTGTRDALNQAAEYFRDSKYGARPTSLGVPRVAVVLTDGACVVSGGRHGNFPA